MMQTRPMIKLRANAPILQDSMHWQQISVRAHCMGRLWLVATYKRYKGNEAETHEAEI